MTTYNYDAVGNLQNFVYPNGVTHAYNYDPLNRLTQMGAAKSGALSGYAYTLGAAGNRLSVAELSGRTVNYGYDALYRLTSETVTSDPHNNNGAGGYTYDAVGNRKTFNTTMPPAGGNSYTYDADDRLGSDQYDANGNTTSSLNIADSYDFENHLVQKGAVTVVYDGDGNRVSETVGGVTTNYLVDTQNPTGYAQVVDELQSGAVTKTYSYGLERISQNWQLGTGNWQPSFYGYDGHGSVRQLFNNSGTVTDTYDYDAFGNLVNSTGTTPNVYMFAGEAYDAALGLYYNRARYLNTTTGRFWSMDTHEGQVDDPFSLHKYLYAATDPVNEVDPSGREYADVAITLAIQGAISGGVSGLLTYAITRDVKASLASAAGGFIVGVFFGAAGEVVKGLLVAKTAGELALATGDVLIASDKLRYLLELDAGKALGFKLLGYTLDNAGDLENILLASRDLITEETEKVVTKYGTKYVVEMEIVGANGMRGLVQVVWQQDVGTTIFRLITAIPKPYGAAF